MACIFANLLHCFSDRICTSKINSSTYTTHFIQYLCIIYSQHKTSTHRILVYICRYKIKYALAQNVYLNQQICAMSVTTATSMTRRRRIRLIEFICWLNIESVHIIYTLHNHSRGFFYVQHTNMYVR